MNRIDMPVLQLFVPNKRYGGRHKNHNFETSMMNSIKYKINKAVAKPLDA